MRASSNTTPTSSAHIGWLEAAVPSAVWRHCLTLAARSDLPYGSLRNMATVMVLDALRLQPWHHDADWLDGLHALAHQQWQGDASLPAQGMVRADLRLLGLQDRNGTLVETGIQMAEGMRAAAAGMDVPEELFVAATVLWWTRRAARRSAPRRPRAPRRVSAARSR